MTKENDYTLNKTLYRAGLNPNLIEPTLPHIQFQQALLTIPELAFITK